MIVAELAEAVGTSEATVRRWIQAGQIEAKLPYNSRKLGYRILIGPTLERWREEGLSDRVSLVESYLAEKTGS